MSKPERVSMRTMVDACHNPHNYKDTKLIAKLDKHQIVAYENTDGKVDTTTVPSLDDAIKWFKTKELAYDSYNWGL